MEAEQHYDVEGKVIQIINEYTIVVNLGEGIVEVGDYLNILDHEIDIVDPVTGKKLGVYTFVKDTVKVSEVFHGYCICGAYKTEVIESGIAFAVNPLLKSKKRIIPLEVNPEDNKNVNLENKTISIGDSVFVK